MDRAQPSSIMSAGERACEICGREGFVFRFEKGGYRYERCSNCGLERINPPPSDADLAAIYGDQYYDAWGLTENEDLVRSTKKATFSRVLAAAGPLPPGSKILDCGAATGFLMEAAADFGYDPYGIEISARGARAITDRFGHAHVCHGAIEDARFPALAPQPFAAAFMCDYLEHVRDPAAVLRRVAGWLAPSATLVLTTPRIDSLTHRTMGANWSHYKTEHLYYFSADNLARLLSQTGFTVVSTTGMRKVVTIDFVRNYFTQYPHPRLSPLARALARLPAALRNRQLGLVMGEMLVVARRA